MEISCVLNVYSCVFNVYSCVLVCQNLCFGFYGLFGRVRARMIGIYRKCEIVCMCVLGIMFVY